MSAPIPRDASEAAPARYETPAARRGQGIGAGLRLLALAAILLAPACRSSRAEEAARPRLRVLTLDLRHGRGRDGSAGEPAEVVRARLAAIADLLRRERVDVAALQRADAASASSGGFDHVAFLAERSGLGSTEHGIHADDGETRSGTAILSRFPLDARDAAAFVGTSAESQGYGVARLVREGRELDVVSVRLDDRISALRLDQVRSLAGELSRRGRPLVLAGDLWSEWEGAEKTIHELAERLHLSAWRPDGKGLATYPAGRPERRFDWILVSPELEILSCRTLDDPVSDHRAVLAEIAWRE